MMVSHVAVSAAARKSVFVAGAAAVAAAAAARRDSLEFGASASASATALQEYARKWGPSPLSPPLTAALGPVGLRPVSAAPGAETAKYRCASTSSRLVHIPPPPPARLLLGSRSTLS